MGELFSFLDNRVGAISHGAEVTRLGAAGHGAEVPTPS
jgi:hypothetical protein